MSRGKRGTDRDRSSDYATPASIELTEPGFAKLGDAVVDDNPAREPPQHALFKDVPPDILQPLVQRCEIRSLPVGEILLRPGQINKNLYLLLYGRLTAHIDRVDSEEGFAMGPGECAGEISVIDAQPATAYVVADEPSKVLVLPERMLWDELFTIPQITRNFMRLFADRFRSRSEAMQRSLEQQLRYEHLQRELGIAHDIQLGMLSRQIDLEPEIDVAAQMTPAQQVGGDFYDAFPVGTDEYCVAIGDVSGKGVPAALFMVRTMTLLRTELRKDQPIDLSLNTLNKMLCDENPTCMFATLVIGILNKRTGELRYVNAGHDPLILGQQGTAYRPLPPPRGILVGFDEGATYEVGSLTLNKGDVLLMFTDGVTEAMNPQGQPFTMPRLMVCLSERPAASARELADRIEIAVHEFTAGAPQSDDLTMLILRYRGT